MSTNFRRMWRTFTLTLLVATMAAPSIAAARPTDRAGAAPAPQAIPIIICQGAGTATLAEPLGLTGNTSTTFTAEGSLNGCFRVGFPLDIFGAQFTMEGFVIQSSCTAAAAFAPEGELTWDGGPHDGNTSHFNMFAIGAANTGGKVEGHFLDGPLEGALIVAIPTNALVTQILNDCANNDLSQVTGTAEVIIAQ
jgi:hypothetical protein